MRERGRVTELKESLARVQLEFSVACESCVNGACAVTRRSIEAVNPGGLDLVPGDFVEIEIDNRRSLVGALLVYGPPVLLFVLGYFGAASLFSPAKSDALRAIGGLIGMALGVLVAWLAARSRRLEALPRITGRIDGLDLAAGPGPATESA